MFILVCLACAIQSRRVNATVSAWYPVKVAVVFVITFAIVIARRGEHPFAQFGPANVVTSLRAVLVALVAGLIGEAPNPQLASGAAVAAVLVTMLHGLDRQLPRRAGAASASGARFD